LEPKLKEAERLLNQKHSRAFDKDTNCKHPVLLVACTVPNSLEFVKKLIEKYQVDPHSECEKGMTALSASILCYISSRTGSDWEKIHYLLQRVIRADSIRNPPVGTALGASITLGDFKLTMDLINKGANSTIKTTRGHDALFYAAQSGRLDTIDYLLSTKSDDDESHFTFEDINERSNDGSTPLLLAAQRGQLEAVKLLMEHQKRRLRPWSLGRRDRVHDDRDGECSIDLWLDCSSLRRTFRFVQSLG